MTMSKRTTEAYQSPVLQGLENSWGGEIENICLTTSADPEIDDVTENDWGEI